MSSWDLPPLHCAVDGWVLSFPGMALFNLLPNPPHWLRSVWLSTLSPNHIETIKTPRKKSPFTNDYFPFPPVFPNCAANQVDMCMFGISLNKWGDDVISQERCYSKCEDQSSLNKGRLKCGSKMEVFYVLFAQKKYEEWTNKAVKVLMTYKILK